MREDCFLLGPFLWRMYHSSLERWGFKEAAYKWGAISFLVLKARGL